MRNPTIACTPSEVSCTGVESVFCWTTSTSSWEEQSYATRSLPTAWPYTLVQLEDFIQLIKKDIQFVFIKRVLSHQNCPVRSDTAAARINRSPATVSGTIGNRDIRLIRLFHVFVSRAPILVSPSTVASTHFNDKFYYAEMHYTANHGQCWTLAAVS